MDGYGEYGTIWGFYHDLTKFEYSIYLKRTVSLGSLGLRVFKPLETLRVRVRVIGLRAKGQH